MPTVRSKGCRGARGTCGREVVALGLCRAHHRRHLRGGSIDTPVRARDSVRVPSVWVPRDVAHRLAARGGTLYEATQSALTEWARYLDGQWAPKRARGK